MLRKKVKAYNTGLLLACFIGCIIFGMGKMSVQAAPLITTVEELKEAMMNAQEGDTILVGDIEFKPMPMGMMQIPKNLTIQSGKDGNAVFSNATFALNGTSAGAEPLTVRFEGIDFVGDNADNQIDTMNPPNVSSKMPGIMKTMCAGIFKMNLDVTYSGCTFTGYHYGYGGVFNAIYSSEDNKNELTLTLENCKFFDNAGSYGGVAYLIGSNHNIHFKAKNCIFEGNGAATGGAIWAESASLKLTDCVFSDQLYMEEAVAEPVGGAMALYNCATEMERCVLKNNTAGSMGGGIFCEVAPFHTLVMQYCTLCENRATTNGAIHVVPMETNFDTELKAYIYFTSVANNPCETKDSLLENDLVSLFGCFVSEDTSLNQTPAKENGYCLVLPITLATEKGYTPDETGRLILPLGTAQIPKEEIEKTANGKYEEYAEVLQPGDNNPEEALAAMLAESFGQGEISGSEKTEETFVDEKVMEMIHDGQENNTNNSYIIWIIVSAALLMGAGTGSVILYHKKRRKTDAVSMSTDSSGNWMERALESPEIAKLLSNREREVLPLLLKGHSREQIAKELYISESTVKKHASSIYTKLGVSGKAELIAKMAGK